MGNEWVMKGGGRNTDSLIHWLSGCGLLTNLIPNLPYSIQSNPTYLALSYFSYLRLRGDRHGGRGIRGCAADARPREPADHGGAAGTTDQSSVPHIG